MKASKYKLYDIIEVTWIDSHSGGGWKVPSEIAKWIKEAKNNFTIKTIGYFFDEDQDFLRICQSHDNQSQDPDGSRLDNLDEVYAVAKPCIKEIKVIRKQ